MFGLFGKKKPKSAMDEFTRLIYGDNPPAKSADVRRAVSLAESELLGGLVDFGQVERLARELDAGPLPYSTHDLAVSVAQNFYMKSQPSEMMRHAAEEARETVFKWGREGLVVTILAKTFIGKISDYLGRLEEPSAEKATSPTVRKASDFTDAQFEEFIVEKVKHSPDFDLVRSWLSGDINKNSLAIANICIKRIRAAEDAKGLFGKLCAVTDTWTNDLEPFMNASEEPPSPKVLDAAVQVVSQILIFPAVIVELYKDPDLTRVLAG